MAELPNINPLAVKYKEKWNLATEFQEIAPKVQEPHLMKAALKFNMKYATVKRRLAGWLGADLVSDRALLEDLKQQVEQDTTS
jgi:hypothetical protein